MTKYDVIVVGARCGGSPTAMLLARHGHRVLLLDKATFPSDTLSTHLVRPFGVRQLKRWGLLDRVLASGSPPIVRVMADYGNTILEGTVPDIDGVFENLAPRRSVLDSILVDGARAAGVEVREDFVVEEILREGEVVCGVRGHTAGGESVSEHALMVIGADGKRSLVARTVAAAEYNTQPPQMCWYYTYWSDLQVERYANGVRGESYQREKNFCFFIPTNRDQVCLFVGWPISEFAAVKSNIEKRYLETLRTTMPTLYARVADGRRDDRFYGTADLPSFMRRPFGPGWALVGDAGIHQDPVLGHGIFYALRDAELLADAVHAGLAGERPLHDALQDYEVNRNAAASAYYELGIRLASLNPVAPETVRLRESLRGDVDQTNRYLGISAATVRVESFFTPEILRRSQGVTAAMERREARWKRAKPRNP